jgi:hypothetical protein
LEGKRGWRREGRKEDKGKLGFSLGIKREQVVGGGVGGGEDHGTTPYA